MRHTKMAEWMENVEKVSVCKMFKMLLLIEFSGNQQDHGRQGVHLR